VGNGKLRGYCGINEYGWIYLLISFCSSWLLVDLFEFTYHQIGHRIDLFWNIHKVHHKFEGVVWSSTLFHMNIYAHILFLILKILE